jgi:hypothetical protein
MVSVARKLSTIEEQRKEQNCFGEKITGIEATNPKIVLGSSLDEDVGFRDNYSFFCDIQRYVSSNQVYDQLPDNKE